MKKIKWIVLGFALCGGIMLISSKKNTIQKIEQDLLIELKTSVTIVQEEVIMDGRDEYLRVKFLVKEGRIDSLKKQLNRTFIQIDPETKIIPNFKKTCSWWDVDKKSVTGWYMKSLSGKDVRTINVWVLLVEGEEDHMYVYY